MRQSKFTQSDIQLIVKLCRERESYRKIAEKFNTSAATISNILNGKFKTVETYMGDFSSASQIKVYKQSDICRKWLKDRAVSLPYKLDRLYSEYVQDISEKDFVNELTNYSQNKVMHTPLSVGVFRKIVQEQYLLQYIALNKEFLVVA